MHSKIELVRKRIHYWWRYVAFLSEEHFLLILFALSSVVILSDQLSSFKQMVVFSITVSLLLNFRIKNLFVSFFSVALFFLPFFNPNKYYTVEVIPGAEILLTEFKEGYYLGYGLNVSTVLVIFALFFLVKDLLLKRRVSSKIFRNKLIILSLLSWLTFILTGLYSSVTLSPFPQASITWLFQYAQVVTYAFSTLSFFLFYKSKVQLLLSVLLSMILFQSIVALHQFVLQSHVGHVVEFGRGASFYTGADENNALFRVSGTFLFHNQFALIQLILSLILIPSFLRSPNKVHGATLVSGLFTSFLAQSRAIWVCMFLIFLFVYRFYRKQLISIAKKFSIQSVWYFFLFMLVLLFIFIPRFLLTFNTFSTGSSGTIRIKMLEEATQAFQISPWFGFGVGTNEYVLHNLFPQGVMSVFPAAVHLAFLQIMLEIGIIGLAFLLFPILYLLRTLLVKNTLTSKLHDVSDFSFIFLLGILVFFTYYCFQPHVGIVEFPILGLVVGLGLSTQSNTI